MRRGKPSGEDLDKGFAKGDSRWRFSEAGNCSASLLKTAPSEHLRSKPVSLLPLACPSSQTDDEGIMERTSAINEFLSALGKSWIKDGRYFSVKTYVEAWRNQPNWLNNPKLSVTFQFDSNWMKIEIDDLQGYGFPYYFDTRRQTMTLVEDDDGPRLRIDGSDERGDFTVVLTPNCLRQAARRLAKARRSLLLIDESEED